MADRGESPMNVHVFRLYVLELQWQAGAALRAMDELEELIVEAYRQATTDLAKILRRGHKHASLPSLSRPGLFKFDQRQCFDHADEFLMRAATVSHLLHPGPVHPRPRDDRDERKAWADARGAALREALEVELTAATETGVRNHVAHIDEKIDGWARLYEAAATANGVESYDPGISHSDRIVTLNSGRATIEKFGRQRALVIDPPTYIVRDQELNLQEVAGELERVKEAADRWLAEYDRSRSQELAARQGLQLD